eukprot:4009774-Ditylum_brightwellii.AAC.2
MLHCGGMVHSRQLALHCGGRMPPRKREKAAPTGSETINWKGHMPPTSEKEGPLRRMKTTGSAYYPSRQLLSRMMTQSKVQHGTGCQSM